MILYLDCDCIDVGAGNGINSMFRVLADEVGLGG